MVTNTPLAPCDSDGDGASRRAADDDNSETPARSPSLAKSVGQLASGRAIAVAVTVLTMPIVTRLYDEKSMGIMGLIGAVILCLHPASSGFCYYRAMPLATTLSQRRVLFVLSVTIGVLLAAVLAMVVLFAGQSVATAIKKPELGKYLIFLPLFCLASTITSSTTMALNCEKRFGRVAARTGIQGVVRRVVQIGAGLLGLRNSAAGLLLGSLAAVYVNGLAYSLAPVKALWRGSEVPFRLTDLKPAAVQYKDFPLFRYWTETLTALTGNFPMLFLGLFFPLQVTGCYAVARALLVLPLRLFTQTSREVFYIEATQSMTRGESTASAASQLLRLLSVLTAFPLTAVFVLGPLLFEIALGSRWHEAGIYAQILVPAVAILAVGQPLSAMFDATRKLAEGLLCNIVLLATQAVLMILGGYLSGAWAALVCYTAGTVLVWVYILARTLGLARVGRVRAARMLTAPYIEAILLLSPAGVLYWGLGMKIAALIALGVMGVVQAVILHVRYPQIRRKLTRVILRR